MERSIRRAVPGDLNQISAIEAVCFPPAEACAPAQFRARLAAFPECFYVAQVGGQTVGFINGACTDRPALPDRLYANAALHQPAGSWQTVFGLAVLPAFRRHGVAGCLLAYFLGLAQGRGKQGVVLTCKDPLIPYYQSFGFVRQGVSASTHGGAQWNDMLLRF